MTRIGGASPDTGRRYTQFANEKWHAGKNLCFPFQELLSTSLSLIFFDSCVKHECFRPKATGQQMLQRVTFFLTCGRKGSSTVEAAPGVATSSATAPSDQRRGGKRGKGGQGKSLSISRM